MCKGFGRQEKARRELGYHPEEFGLYLVGDKDLLKGLKQGVEGLSVRGHSGSSGRLGEVN